MRVFVKTGSTTSDRNLDIGIFFLDLNYLGSQSFTKKFLRRPKLPKNGPHRIDPNYVQK